MAVLFEHRATRFHLDKAHRPSVLGPEQRYLDCHAWPELGCNVLEPRPLRLLCLDHQHAGTREDLSADAGPPTCVCTHVDAEGRRESMLSQSPKRTFDAGAVQQLLGSGAQPDP